jgi:hypothetical protein
MRGGGVDVDIFDHVGVVWYPNRFFFAEQRK